MSKMEKKAILARIEKLEKILDNWRYYDNAVGYQDIRKELDQLYSKLEE